jgi:hypothetical protein
MNTFLLIIIILIILLIIIYISCPNLHITNTIIPFYKRKDNVFPNIEKLNEITIFCSSGLSNRIRTILGFLHVCKMNNKKLNVIWLQDNTCNGNFLDYFEHINNVNFFDKIVEPIDFIGQSTIENILKHYNLNIEAYKLYSNIKLNNNIENKVQNFVSLNNIHNLVGVHVRRTDYTGNFIGKIINGSNDDNEFFDFINKYSKGFEFFIATDNKETQNIYKNKYGKKALFYSTIKNSKNLRKTSLENAIIDIFILSYCKKIKGTYNSSFTEFARLLKKNRLNNFNIKI